MTEPSPLRIVGGIRFQLAVRTVEIALDMIGQGLSFIDRNAGWTQRRISIARSYLLDRQTTLANFATSEPNVRWGPEGQLYLWGIGPKVKSDLADALLSAERAFDNLREVDGYLSVLEGSSLVLSRPLSDMDRQWGWDETKLRSVHNMVTHIEDVLASGGLLEKIGLKAWMNLMADIEAEQGPTVREIVAPEVEFATPDEKVEYWSLRRVRHLGGDGDPIEEKQGRVWKAVYDTNWLVTGLGTRDEFVTEQIGKLVKSGKWNV